MMTNGKPTSERQATYRNYPGALGWFIIVGCILAFFVLLVLDVLAPAHNPYLGIFTYLVIPCLLVLGLALAAVGLVVRRRWIIRHAGGSPPPLLVIDLARPHAVRRIVITMVVGVVFLTLVMVMSYQAYHFSESVPFCGQACHVPMEPEFTTYPHGSHARVSCTACHIGPGAEWFVKAKISGLRQVYAVWFDKYHRPIKTPIDNLRPAQDTCENCHWPEKFTGDLDRVYTHYLSDATNTPFTVRLSLKVGGSDLAHGPVGGIHWHMNVGNRIEYIATDERRQVIPWVRVTNRQGVVTEYQTAAFKTNAAKAVVRTMDCIDCHNRPAHIFQSPNDAVDLALSLGKIDSTLPNVKKTALQVLTQTYTSTEEAQQKIATGLAAKYAKDPRCQALINVVQGIYRDNFFPLMKTDWKTHPNNIGHKEWPGCFRCHDGEHKTADGKKSIQASNCSACHVLLAQGRGEELLKLNAQGKPFEHPGGDVGDTKCSECHTGGNQ
jgi:nitrate/TMAO reductase-like tetraheme cytochrome c subunit